MRLSNRRGLSPLIATVLLMAFAVALGGMIMNWSTDIDSRTKTACGDVRIEVGHLCAGVNTVEFTAVNAGEKELSSLELVIDVPGSGTFPVKVPGPLATGKSISSKIPFVVTPETGLSVFARVSDNGQELSCTTPAHTLAPLPKC